MKTKIYYRSSTFKDELEFAQKYFDCVSIMSQIESGDLVIPRYSMWPFFKDQESEIKYNNGKLINDYSQYQFSADLQNYVSALGDLTPRTWDNLQDLPENCPFILKGETSSRKNDWNKTMFASNKQEAMQVADELSKDQLIGKIYIREYIPLVSYMEGIGGIPISKEFRFFVIYGKIFYSNFYWMNYSKDLSETPSPNEIPIDFLEQAIKKIGNKSNFYAMDIAQTKSGEWIIIELNDGSCAGIPEDYEKFYFNMKNILDERKENEK